MHNLQDEEFDRICREAADSPEARIPADRWEKLRERLDQEMPESRGRRRRWLPWIPFFLCLPLAMLTWKQTSPPAKVPARLESMQGETINGPSAGGNSDDPVFAGKTIQESAADFHSQPTQDNAVGKVNATGTVAGNWKKSQGESAENRVSENNRLKSSPGWTKATGKASAGQDAKTGAAEDTGVHRGMTAADMAIAVDMIHPYGHDTLSKVTDLVAGRPADKFSDSSAVSARPLPPGNPHARTMNTRMRGFTFSAVFGPDFSNVGFSSPDQAGLNAGLIIGFRFNDRWSIQAGALYSRKHYTAIGDDYQGYPGYNPSNPALVMDKVEAICFMWDFPLNVRYDLIVRPKHRVYAVAGLSSYLMNREDLHYYYKYNNIPRYKHWENRSQSMYWFSAFNISAGYALQFMPRWSASVEPYLKLPVQQVGYGNIDINSLGLLLGITYHPQWHQVKSTKK